MENIQEAIFWNNPIPMLLLRGESKEVTDINHAFKQRFDTVTEITGLPFHEITKPISSNFDTGESSDGSREIVVLSLPNSTSKMIEVTVQQIENGEHPRYLATVSELFPPLVEKGAIHHPIFKSIFDKALDIILVANDEGQFVQANETACKKLGYSQDELLNMGVEDITFTPMKSYKDKKWDDFLRTGTDEGEYLLETKSGEVIYTEYRAIANIRPSQHLSILRDVSKTIQIEEKLEASEDRFRRLLDAAPDAIFVVDRNGKILFSNPEAEKMMGYNEEELIGSPIEILVPDFARKKHKKYCQQYTENPHKRPMGADLELLAVRKDGSKVPVDIMLGPLQENGDLHTLAVVRDVSDFQQAQDKLKREQAFTKLLHSLTKIANEAQELNEALDKASRLFVSLWTGLWAMLICPQMMDQENFIRPIFGI